MRQRARIKASEAIAKETEKKDIEALEGSERRRQIL